VGGHPIPAAQYTYLPPPAGLQSRQLHRAAQLPFQLPDAEAAGSSHVQLDMLRGQRHQLLECQPDNRGGAGCAAECSGSRSLCWASPGADS
jgi:hypothetical protein